MNKLKKIIYVTVGLISLLLGTIGAVLPVLPTAPFLLLASYCFAKGSDKFDKWFKSTKLYKNNLKSFVENREMTLKQKIGLNIFADIMIAFPFFILDSLYIKLFLVMVVAYKYYYFIFRIKTIKNINRVVVN